MEFVLIVEEAVVQGLAKLVVEEADEMNRKSRLSRYEKYDDMLRRKRLEMVSYKKAMVRDILSLAGEAKLQQIDEEICGLGDSLEESLMSLPPSEIADIHRRLLSTDTSVVQGEVNA